MKRPLGNMGNEKATRNKRGWVPTRRFGTTWSTNVIRGGQNPQAKQSKKSAHNKSLGR